MKRLLSLATLYPNAARPRFGTFVASSMQALAARPDWEVTVINPIGLPPVRMGEYRALEEAAVDGRSNGLSVYRPSFTLLPKVGGRLNPAMIARAVLPLARELHARQPFDLIDAQFFYPDGPAAATIPRAGPAAGNQGTRGGHSLLGLARLRPGEDARCSTAGGPGARGERGTGAGYGRAGNGSG